MLRIDKRTPDQARSMLAWMAAEPPTANAAFWRKNVLSATTWRRQWDRLAGCMVEDARRADGPDTAIRRFLRATEDQPPALTP
jgi:hypothetical protein